MNVYDFIAQKRDGGEHSDADIAAWIRGVSDGSIADYQVGAWLMAVYLRGMTARETLALTLAMRDSGRTIDLSRLLNGPALDKHSTGGVGDKTTLAVVPLLAAAGIPLLKMSGRGLGYSGGTVDKLEAIPGFRTDLSVEQAVAQTERIGAALIAQSAELAPADKALYALRDVTATIESLPLIASSIMSKKLAAGAGRILLDVKVGRGAFMKTQERAEALARTMIAIGNGAGVPTGAMLTAMDEPLGRTVGNALEVREALLLLTDPASAEPMFRDLCIELAAHGLTAMGKSPNEEAAKAAVNHLLESGAAARKFAEISAAQGGPDNIEEILRVLPTAAKKITVTAQETGRVAECDAEATGRLAVTLGAGRARKTDVIDPAVGIEFYCKTGDRIAAGEPLAALFLRPEDAGHAEAFAAVLRSACFIMPDTAAVAASHSLILAVLE